MKAAAIAATALLAAMPLAGSVAVAQHAALATASPYATQIGLEVMKRGGDAIDAAVAVAFALAVAYPEAGKSGKSLVKDPPEVLARCLCLPITLEPKATHGGHGGVK